MRWLLPLFMLTGCASEQRIQQRWDDYVEEHNSCEVASDCAIVSPGCPLDCWSAVSVDDVDEAEQTAERLIRRYEGLVRSCNYGCLAPGELSCEAGACTIGPMDTGGAAR